MRQAISPLIPREADSNNLSQIWDGELSYHHRCPRGQGDNQDRSRAHSGRSQGNFHSAETHTGQVLVHDTRQCLRTEAGVRKEQKRQKGKAAVRLKKEGVGEKAEVRRSREAAAEYGLSPRHEARSGPARCPGGQMHSKEPSVLVQIPLWQRSSSLHSSTSAGQSNGNPGPHPALLNIPGHTPPIPPSWPSKFQSLQGRAHPIRFRPRLFL